MKIWKNTATIDAWLHPFDQTNQSKQAQVAILGSKPVILEDFPQLKAIFKCGVGTDNVPFEECSKRGIIVGLPRPQTASIIYDETAAFAVHLIYRMLYSDVGELGSWEKKPRLPMKERKLLVLGTGNIGKRVLGYFEGRMELDSYDQLKNDGSELESKLRWADVVSIHLPLDTSTRNFLNTERLALLKEGACIVNTARGPIVEEQALLKEIQQDRLRAAFDVFWQEPYRGALTAFHPDRFLMTPHVASTNIRFLESLADDFIAFMTSINSGGSID